MAADDEWFPHGVQTPWEGDGLRPLSPRPRGFFEHPTGEGAELLKAWFLNNFEDLTSYDRRDGGYRHVWGPWDAGEILGKIFWETGTPHKMIDRAIATVHYEGAKWVPARWRIIPRDEPDAVILDDESRPVEHNRNGADLYVEMQGQIRDLQARLATLEQVQVTRLHNNPPEAVGDEPLDLVDQQELGAALATLQSQPVDPPDGAAAGQAVEVVRSKGEKIRVWLAAKREAILTTAINTAVTEAVKTLWQQYWEGVLRGIVAVGRTAANWLASFLPF